MAQSPSKCIELRGRPIEIRYRAGLRDTAGNQAHATTFIRQRLIVLDLELRREPDEHGRILAHELFHFVWVRLSNKCRLSWELLLVSEWNSGAQGEAGWSAEWRKARLDSTDVLGRTRRWREYCCEAFCDTAALVHTQRRGERTLPLRHVRVRATWFNRNLARAPHI